MIQHLRKVLNAMNLMDLVVRMNDEDVELQNGSKLSAVPPDLKHARGTSYDHLIFITTNQNQELPAPRGETYMVSLDFGENYERRQAIRRHQGPWNADLKMSIVG